LSQFVAAPFEMTAAETPLILTVTLNWSDPAGLDAYVSGIRDKKNPILSMAELTARFGPTPDAYRAVVAYFERSGFTIVEALPNRLTITFQGTRARAERAFAIKILDHKTDGRTFFANDSDPAVPENIAPFIRAISGLNNLAISHPGVAPSPPDPLSITTAYGLKGLPPGINGQGQTIALVEFDNYNVQDVVLWLATVGLPAGAINQLRSVSINGGSGVSGGGGTKEALVDIAAALGTAPGANIITVIAPQGTAPIEAINAALNQVLSPPFGRGGIVSISWARCEREVSDSDADSLQSLVQAFVATGASLFASTGDNGPTCVGGDGTRYANRVNYPAGVPGTVGVGGTILQVNAGNTYAGESWWTSGDSGGGFGTSRHFPRPAYQNSFTNSSGRSVPDVSAYVGPVRICQSGNCFGQIGTSVSAPLWAGYWALACQAAALGPFLPCPSANSGVLYTLRSSAFNSPASMSGAGNDFDHLGLGSPNLPGLVSQIAGPPSVSSLSPASGPVLGGPTITIKGSNFVGVTSVVFEGAGNAQFFATGPREISAIVPALSQGISGLNHVIVRTAAGASDPNDASVFTYKPLVTGVSPPSGPIGGHTAVTITGFGLSPQISFGGVDALEGKRCDSDRQCDAPTPPGQPGPVHVTVGGSDPNNNDIFTYETPTITRVEPKVGPEEGKIYVHVYGTGFATGIGVDPSVMSMEFCPATGSCTPSPLAECTDTQSCSVFVPAGKGTVDIVARAGNGMSSPRDARDQFSYLPFPTISGLTPVTGLATGGTQVSITGTNFAIGRGATQFNFGEGASADGDCDSATHCTVTSPPGTGGVYLTATVGGAIGFRNTGATFAYIPVVKGVDPTTGLAIGGDQVTIIGAGFIDRDAFGDVHPGTVAFGTSAATGLCSDASRCTVASPAGSGTVDVSVTAGDESSRPNAPADQFTYGPAGVAKGWTKWNFNPLPGPVDTVAYDAARKAVVGLGAWVVDTSVNNCPPPEDLPPGEHCVPPPPKFVQVAQTVTWNIDGAGWRQLSPPTLPRPGAVNRGMAFHSATGNMVLFGGQYLVGLGPAGEPSNATWLWDGVTWTDANPTPSPPARFGSSMTYDPVRQVIVLFGGCATAGCTMRLNDTWTWNGRTWQQQFPAQSPPARNGASFAFVTPAGKAVLFGGAGDSSRFLGDTWEWDGSNWTQLTTAISPSPRRDAPLVETPAGLILFDGSVPGLPPPDTWLFAAGSWKQLHPSTSPGLSGPMAFDVDKQEAACVCANGETWTWGGE
jgi:hypothetical protein